MEVALSKKFHCLRLSSTPEPSVRSELPTELQYLINQSVTYQIRTVAVNVHHFSHSMHAPTSIVNELLGPSKHGHGVQIWDARLKIESKINLISREEGADDEGRAFVTRSPIELAAANERPRRNSVNWARLPSRNDALHNPSPNILVRVTARNISPGTKH